MKNMRGVLLFFILLIGHLNSQSVIDIVKSDSVFSTYRFKQEYLNCKFEYKAFNFEPRGFLLAKEQNKMTLFSRDLSLLEEGKIKFNYVSRNDRLIVYHKGSNYYQINKYGVKKIINKLEYCKLINREANSDCDSLLILSSDPEVLVSIKSDRGNRKCEDVIYQCSSKGEVIRYFCSVNEATEVFDLENNLIDEIEGVYYATVSENVIITKVPIDENWSKYILYNLISHKKITTISYVPLYMEIVEGEIYQVENADRISYTILNFDSDTLFSIPEQKIMKDHYIVYLKERDSSVGNGVIISRSNFNFRVNADIVYNLSSGRMLNYDDYSDNGYLFYGKSDSAFVVKEDSIIKRIQLEDNCRNFNYYKRGWIGRADKEKGERKLYNLISNQEVTIPLHNTLLDIVWSRDGVTPIAVVYVKFSEDFKSIQVLEDLKSGNIREYNESIAYIGEGCFITLTSKSSNIHSGPQIIKLNNFF